LRIGPLNYVTEQVEFLDASCNKGAAIGQLCAHHLGVGLEEVIAFGDNTNDVELLRAVGEGVAMANAKPSVKAQATRVSQWTNQEEGVARELQLLLKQQQ
jgi:hydroxymethylpyrimidine pyrophosphatase-like HAD family hydrolase